MLNGIDSAAIEALRVDGGETNEDTKAEVVIDANERGGNSNAEI